MTKCCIDCGVSSDTKPFRLTKSGKLSVRCEECASVTYYERNKAACKAGQLDWRKRNPDYHRKYERKSKREPKPYSEKDRARAKAYYAANRERILARQAEKLKSVPGAIRAKKAARKAAAIKATPSWADSAKIRKVYADAKEATEIFGVQFDVDHIVPLRSKIVCGLHVESNLRILERDKNVAKGNFHWPDMPD